VGSVKILVKYIYKIMKKIGDKHIEIKETLLKEDQLNLEKNI